MKVTSFRFWFFFLLLAVGAIVGAIVGVLLVLCIIVASVVAVVIYRRRRSGRQQLQEPIQVCSALPVVCCSLLDRKMRVH
jgi:hypothetical protein